MEPIVLVCAKIIFNSDDVDVLKETINSDKDSDYISSRTIPGTNRTLLMACAKQGRALCLKFLLNIDPESIDIQNNIGFTALHYAAFHGHEEVVFALLEHGADTTILNSYKETFLLSAIMGNHHQLADQLRESHYLIPKQTVPYFDEDAEYRKIVERHNKTNNKHNPTIYTSTPSSSSTKPGLSRPDASLFSLEVMAIAGGDDVNRSQVGQTFLCLASQHPGTLSSVSASGDDLAIGRGADNHVVISDLSLSKQHAVLAYFEDKGFVLRDLGSKHGSFINGQRIGLASTGDISNDRTGNYLLSEGAEVRLGRVTLRVRRKRHDVTRSSG
jgi:hypothetical protein